MDHRNDSFHFRILQDIAQDLSGDVNFPTWLDAAIVVRNTLREENVSLEKVVQVISVEPLIASKLLRLSNSVPYNPSGRAISDLKAAISRLGFEAVRTTSLAVAMDQMRKSGSLEAFGDLPKLAWEHSLQVAAVCRVLARRIGRTNPDEALLVGMVHDIGIFYLLYRAAEYPEYQENQEAVLELLVGWHESIGESLLQALGLPDRIIEAVRDHDRPHNSTENPCTLRDVLYFANLLAGSNFEWLPGGADPAKADLVAQERARYADLLEEAEDEIRELRAALAA